MGKIENIEQEIQRLPLKDLARFREWFLNYDNEAWDRQLEDDAANGKLETLAKEAEQEYRRGQFRPL